MPLQPVATRAMNLVPDRITDEEGESMLRAVFNLFGKWGITDEEAGVLLDLPVRTYRRWKAGQPGRLNRDMKARLSEPLGNPQSATYHLWRCRTKSRLDQGAERGFSRPFRSRRHAWRRTDRLDAGSPIRRCGARRLVVAVADVPISQIQWQHSVRIIRGVFPPINLFEDIAEPEDWSFLVSAEQKTNPRQMETIGNIDLVPAERRVRGPGASYLMAPFTHTTVDWPSRFSAGRQGVLYVARDFEPAVCETAYHHARFMAATNEAPGWGSRFRELLIDVIAELHDIRGKAPVLRELLDPDNCTKSQQFGASLLAIGSEGIACPSVRGEGDCAGLFYPDLAHNPAQGRHLEFQWDGTRVDLVRNAATGDVFRIVEQLPRQEW